MAEKSHSKTALIFRANNEQCVLMNTVDLPNRNFYREYLYFF